MFTVYTFGDSILDCGHYNEHDVTPGGLIVRNNDALFPEFRGFDLRSRRAARLVQGARDGATVSDLIRQARGLTIPDGPAVALITIGGNDLLNGLVFDRGPAVGSFAQALEDFVDALPVRPVFLGDVYDPTCGDDSRNFLGLDPAVARAALARVNAAIAAVAAGVEGGLGKFVALHDHFLTGDTSWFVNVIEPSLRGASEVRRAFLPGVLATAFGDAEPLRGARA
jgi:acyl-CoA thioesterase-1